MVRDLCEGGPFVGVPKRPFFNRSSNLGNLHSDRSVRALGWCVHVQSLGRMRTRNKRQLMQDRLLEPLEGRILLSGVVQLAAALDASSPNASIQASVQLRPSYELF